MTITAHASVVQMPPGRYQIATVLKGKINTGGWSRPHPPRKPPRKRRFNLTKGVALRKMEEYVDSLPDDASELLPW
jgi:hypothetical protein